MHPGAMNNMKYIKEKYLADYLNKLRHPIKVLDVGGIYDVPHKTYRKHFTEYLNMSWTVTDIAKHPTTDVLLEEPYTYPFDNEYFDLVVSGQMLEHCVNPFKAVAEMKRVLKSGGMIVLSAPSAGPAHDVRDGWRFMDDGFQFIMEDIGGIETVADWIQTDAPDERSRKWQDHLFVGIKKNES